MKYSGFRGGIIGVSRQVLIDHSFPSGGGIFVLMWLQSELSWRYKGVEILLNHNANNTMIYYNELKFTLRGKMASWICSQATEI